MFNLPRPAILPAGRRRKAQVEGESEDRLWKIENRRKADPHYFPSSTLNPPSSSSHPLLLLLLLLHNLPIPPLLLLVFLLLRRLRTIDRHRIFQKQIDRQRLDPLRRQ